MLRLNDFLLSIALVVSSCVDAFWEFRKEATSISAPCKYLFALGLISFACTHLIRLACLLRLPPPPRTAPHLHRSRRALFSCVIPVWPQVQVKIPLNFLMMLEWWALLQHNGTLAHVARALQVSTPRAHPLSAFWPYVLLFAPRAWSRRPFPAICLALLFPIMLILIAIQQRWWSVYCSRASLIGTFSKNWSSEAWPLQPGIDI